MTHQAPASHATLRGTLSQIDMEWLRLGAAIGELALPGLEAEEISSKLAAVGPTASEDLLTWFQWHNGIDGVAATGRFNRDVACVPVFELLSLDEAIENTQLLRRIARQTQVEGVQFWPSTWLWLLSGHGGDCIAVDTSSTNSTTYHKGRDHDAADAERWGRYDSLLVWAQGLLATLHRPDLGWRRFDATGTADGAWDLPDRFLW